jgi:hypothetical protein
MKLSAVPTAELIRKQQKVLLLAERISTELVRRLNGKNEVKAEKTFAEELKGIKPPNFEQADENWITKQDAAELLQTKIQIMCVYEQRGQQIPRRGVIFGKTSDGYIWCRPSGKRKTFYLKSSLNLQ